MKVQYQGSKKFTPIQEISQTLSQFAAGRQAEVCSNLQSNPVIVEHRQSLLQTNFSQNSARSSKFQALNIQIYDNGCKEAQ